MHLNSALLSEKYAKGSFQAGLKILEIGPDRLPSTFQEIVSNAAISWETLDIYTRDNLTHLSPGLYKFPSPSDHYDIVFSAQVIEHVPKVWEWIREVARVCRPRGKVITVAPTSWPYHEAPIDCWRIFPEAMKALYETAGLDMELCFSGTLEETDYPKIWPGMSSRNIGQVKRSWKYPIKKLLNYPIQCAFDTIAIGVKRERTV